MQITLQTDWLKELGYTDLIERFGYRRESGPLYLNNAYQDLGLEQAKGLKDFLRKNKLAGKDKVAAEASSKLHHVIMALDAREDTQVTNLEALVKCLHLVIGKNSPRGWVWLLGKDDVLTPALVVNIEYISGQRDDKAHTNLSVCWQNRAGEIESTNFPFYAHELVVGNGVVTEDDLLDDEPEDNEEEDAPAEKPTRKRYQRRTVSEMLQFKGIYLDSGDLFEEYTTQRKRYMDFFGKTGHSVMGTGKCMAYTKERSFYGDDYTVTVRNLDCDGRPARLVLDENEAEPLKTNYNWYGTKARLQKDPGAFWGKKKAKIPVRLYLKAFDLDRHTHIQIHVSQIEHRVFQTDIREKLVLPKSDLAFIELLLKSTEIKLNDIVQGKTGGVFILSRGIPGTGKTLTAEVYSEIMKRPLYNIQCSQLGVTEEEVEKRLNLVLRRAERWKAVLLLDEAGVYIAKCGNDVKRSALVSAFLRVLEYFSGLLFMTTNLSRDEIDDAILSRATARLHYKAPTGDLLVRIWEVLSKQFEVAITSKDIEQLVELFPGIVGRDIKNLMKLARFMREATKEKLTMEDWRMLGHFQELKINETVT